MKILRALLVATALIPASSANEPLHWSNPTGGTLGGSTLAISIPGANLGSANLGGSDYAAAPLGFETVIDYPCDAGWTASFAPAIDDPLFYGVFLRGAGGNATGLPVDYTFNVPFVIRSGFAQASVVGSTLRLPGTGFHHGILQFLGPVSSLSCTTTATTNNRQQFTFGLYCDATVYCTAKPGLFCGTPSISYSGVPDANSDRGFVIRAQPARGKRSGIVLYGCSGPAAIPFQGGTLCVQPSPLRRSYVFDSGGTAGGCDGVFEMDWNEFASGSAGGNPDPCVSSPGQRVNAQVWGRDSVATGSFLSNAIEFDM